ncbi:MAG TPA: twin-arginine translocation signal domain-containing protein [Bacteroidota bacterium]|nr:twin-arginine translocation signal domain-containing protein [Bacteroidota bacterium]
MSNLNDLSNRRGFLGKLASGTAALGLTTFAHPLSLAAESAYPLPASDDKALEAWLGKIKGKHRQVFDSMMPDGGMPLAWARVFLMTNKAVGVADGDCTAVVVLRHESIPLAMEDRLWAKYKFGEVFKISDMATKVPSTRNMFWKPKPNELPLPGMGLNELLESGVLVGVCDMALTVYSKHIADEMKVNADECKKDWVSGVFPGIEIIPSGVLAINRAQEHGCTYCWAG